jgi:hypothetical protein
MKIKEIPDFIGELQDLEWLEIRYNSIEKYQVASLDLKIYKCLI